MMIKRVEWLCILSQDKVTLESGISLTNEIRDPLLTLFF